MALGLTWLTGVAPVIVVDISITAEDTNTVMEGQTYESSVERMISAGGPVVVDKFTNGYLSSVNLGSGQRLSDNNSILCYSCGHTLYRKVCSALPTARWLENNRGVENNRTGHGLEFPSNRGMKRLVHLFIETKEQKYSQLHRIQNNISWSTGILTWS